MKKLNMPILLFTLLLLLIACSKNDDNNDNEQQTNSNDVVLITDTNFKEALLDNDNPIIDSNQDGEIQVGEAEAIYELWIDNKGIRNLQGIEAFKNLEQLYANDNVNLESVDFSQNTELELLNLNFTEIASLDLSSNYKLKKLDCYDCSFLNSLIYPDEGGVLEELNVSGSQLSQIETQNLPKLKYLYCRSTKISELNLSENPLFEQLFASENSLLISLNLKNGNINSIIDVQVSNCPLLTSICVDDVDAADAKDPNRWVIDTGVVYSENCN